VWSATVQSLEVVLTCLSQIGLYPFKLYLGVNTWLSYLICWPDTHSIEAVDLPAIQVV